MTFPRLVNHDENDLRARITSVVARIPRGEAWSYAEVARQAGLPRGHRIVARIMASLPEGSKLPWYRVIRADGRPGFGPGTAMSESQLQRLIAEGMERRGDRIILKRPGETT